MRQRLTVLRSSCLLMATIRVAAFLCVVFALHVPLPFFLRILGVFQRISTDLYLSELGYNLFRMCFF
ncbi:Uncharacterised protein [Vibrio cholerae]|nr:Uncharacterised protein [Vibrio cholerae]